MPLPWGEWLFNRLGCRYLAEVSILLPGELKAQFRVYFTIEPKATIFKIENPLNER